MLIVSTTNMISCLYDMYIPIFIHLSVHQGAIYVNLFTNPRRPLPFLWISCLAGVLLEEGPGSELSRGVLISHHRWNAAGHNKDPPEVSIRLRSRETRSKAGGSAGTYQRHVSVGQRLVPVSGESYCLVNTSVAHRTVLLSLGVLGNTWMCIGVFPILVVERT